MTSAPAMPAPGVDAFQAVFAALAAEQPFAAAANQVCRILRERFEAAHAAVAAVDTTTGALSTIALDSSVAAIGEVPGAVDPLTIGALAGPGAHLVASAGDVTNAAGLPCAPFLRARGLTSMAYATWPLADGRAGLVTVAAREPGRLGEPEAAILRTLTQPLLLALDRHVLHEEVTANRGLAEARARILASLGPGATVESVSAVYVTEARRLFGASHAAVSVFARGSLRILALSSEHTSVRDYDRIRDAPTAAGGDGLVPVLSGRTQIVPDLSLTVRGPFEEIALARGIRTLMRAPVTRADGSVAAMISVGQARPFAWNENHLARLVELSTPLGTIIERTELAGREDVRNEQVRSLTRLLSTLSASAGEADVAQPFAHEVNRFLNADQVRIYAFDGESGSRTLIASIPPARTPLPRRERVPAIGLGPLLEAPAAAYDATRDLVPPAWLTASGAERAGSAICARLDGGAGPAGAIIATSARPGVLGQPELAMLAEVTTPLAMLLGRARLLASLQEQTRRTDNILDLVTALAPQESFPALARPVAAALRSMFEADVAIVSTLENGNVRLEGWYAPGDPGRADPPVPGAFPAGWPLLNRARISIDLRLERRPRSPYSETLRNRGFRSLLEVLVGDPSGRACLVTLGATNTRAFTEAMGEQLVQIARPLEAALEYGHMQAEAALRQRRLEMTNRVLRRLSEGGSVSDLARAFLAECRGLFGSRHAAVVRFDAARQVANVVATDSDLFAGLEGEFPFDDVLAYRFVQHPEPWIQVDTRREQPSSRATRMLARIGVHSALRVPLMAPAGAWGAVALWGEGTGFFTADDASRLSTLAGPLGIALERAEAREALAENELKYRSVVTQAEEMIFIVDSETLAVLDANEFTARTLGYEPAELEGMHVYDLVDDEPGAIGANVARVASEGEIRIHERRYRRKDGAALYVDVVASRISYGGRVAVLVMARDISENRMLQRKLMQAQKMESLGEMAGAIAHDFNNLLTTILGFSGILKLSTNLAPDDAEHIDLIEDAARRGAGLTSRLLAFARGGLVRFGAVDLGRVVSDTLRLAGPMLHQRFQVEWAEPPRPVHVEGDEGQIQQAILNIIMNARDAMPDGGRIALELRAWGQQALLTIADTGPGMDEETRMRIFEPFFSTKPIGSGTGLGMAITYGIVQGHHGTIEVDTEVGRGTAFRIALPLLAPAEATLEGPETAPGSGTVLVVDDDDMVRRATCLALTRLGYAVADAASGDAAVEILRERPERFAAVFLDLVMPGMSGAETFRALTAIRPSLPVVVCTGYAADAHIDSQMKPRIRALMRKPFTPDRLVEALAAAGLEAPQPLPAAG